MIVLDPYAKATGDPRTTRDDRVSEAPYPTCDRFLGRTKFPRQLFKPRAGRPGFEPATDQIRTRGWAEGGCIDLKVVAPMRVDRLLAELNRASNALVDLRARLRPGGFATSPDNVDRTAHANEKDR
jgi:hypothetical protein